MGRCGESGTCACAVQAGTGIAVTGDGTPTNPYVVALAAALATVLQVADTASVDLGVTGTGAAGDPYVLTATVNPGVVTPAANPTLDLVGANVADPLTYDTGTREFGVRISADTGNILAVGSDGGLLVVP